MSTRTTLRTSVDRDVLAELAIRPESPISDAPQFAPRGTGILLSVLLVVGT